VPNCPRSKFKRCV